MNIDKLKERNYKKTLCQIEGLTNSAKAALILSSMKQMQLTND